jgi:hypothetical protein
MTNFSLDAVNVGRDVASHSVLRADLGDGRTLVVISGIAMPEFAVNDDEHNDRQVCQLNLRERAELVEHSSATVGLASISNDETAYVFATDEVNLKRNDSGELVLETHLSALGENTSLHRFSYQVVVTNRVVAAEITGTLSWPTAWFRPPSSDPAGVAGVFTVIANEQTFTSTSPPGPASPTSAPFGGGAVEHLTPAGNGQIVAVTVADDTSHASYRIANPPKDRQLKVTVSQHGLHPTGGGEAAMNPTVGGGDLVRLTVAEPARSGVDFVAHRVTGAPA